MSSWEDRMAAAAYARYLDRQRLAQEQELLDNRKYWQELSERHRAKFEAGPPGSCYDCYYWSPHWFATSPGWQHISIDTGDRVCYHSCHDEPVPCAPVIIA